MPHLSKKTRAERRRSESPVCPCGKKAIKKLSSIWTCQRCLDWDKVIPSTDKTRANCGVSERKKRGDL